MLPRPRGRGPPVQPGPVPAGAAPHGSPPGGAGGRRRQQAGVPGAGAPGEAAVVVLPGGNDDRPEPRERVEVRPPELEELLPAIGSDPVAGGPGRLPPVPVVPDPEGRNPRHPPPRAGLRVGKPSHHRRCRGWEGIRHETDDPPRPPGVPQVRREEVPEDILNAPPLLIRGRCPVSRHPACCVVPCSSFSPLFLRSEAKDRPPHNSIVEVPVPLVPHGVHPPLQQGALGLVPYLLGGGHEGA